MLQLYWCANDCHVIAVHTTADSSKIAIKRRKCLLPNANHILTWLSHHMVPAAQPSIHFWIPSFCFPVWAELVC